MFDQLLGAAISSFSPQCLLFNIIGVVIGIVFGAFPGLNGVVGIALLMPLTYGTDPVVGITMLAGIYMGGNVWWFNFCDIVKLSRSGRGCLYGNKWKSDG